MITIRTFLIFLLVLSVVNAGYFSIEHDVTLFKDQNNAYTLRVLDRDTGLGVENATVTLTDSAELSKLTNSRGYVIFNIDPFYAKVMVRVSHENYADYVIVEKVQEQLMPEEEPEEVEVPEIVEVVKVNITIPEENVTTSEGENETTSSLTGFVLANVGSDLLIPGIFVSATLVALLLALQSIMSARHLEGTEESYDADFDLSLQERFDRIKDQL